MAYGLRSIVNSGYMPYGNGRDWCFIGNFDYRNGRRTPDANLRSKKKNQSSGGQPAVQKRGEPREMAQTKCILNSSGGTGLSVTKNTKVDDRVSPKTAGKWRQHQHEDTCNDVIQRAAQSTGTVHNDRWRQQAASSRPVKARLRKSASVPTPLFSSSYQEHGQLHLIGDWSASEWGAAEKHRYHSNSRVYPKKDVPDLPEEPAWQPPDWGAPHKHRYSSMPCFPPHHMQASSEVPKAWTQPEWGVPEKHLHFASRMALGTTQDKADIPK